MELPKRSSSSLPVSLGHQRRKVTRKPHAHSMGVSNDRDPLNIVPIQLKNFTHRRLHLAWRARRSLPGNAPAAHIAPVAGHAPLPDIRPPDLAARLDDLKRQTTAPTSPEGQALT